MFLFYHGTHKLCRLPCIEKFVHILQICIQEVITAQQHVTEISTTEKRVAQFHHSSSVKSTLHDTKEVVELPCQVLLQDVQTL